MEEQEKSPPQEKQKKQDPEERWFLPEEKDKYDEYLRGADDEEPSDAKTFQIQRELRNHKSDVIYAAKSAVRSEMLQTESAGYIQERLTQKEILKEIPEVIAARKFDFELPNGPYKCDVTMNGRGLLLGGSNGHFASFDWYSGNKFFELYPSEEITDITWLNDDNMAAMATSVAIRIVDKNGVQLHEISEKSCLIDFLPRFWLLCSASSRGVLTWMDISTGQQVAQTPTKKGSPQAFCVNSSNGIVCVGHTNGTISLWTPTQSTAAATMFCHPSSLTSIAVDLSGNRIATSGIDGSIRIWDIRNYEKVCQRSYDKAVASCISYSGRGGLGVCRGNRFDFYSNPDDYNCKSNITAKFNSSIKSIVFPPFEDFVIVGLESGIASAVVPGAGEANLDSTIATPFATAKWRQESEVRSLLDKLPPEMITLDPDGPIRVGQKDPNFVSKKKIHDNVKIVKNNKVKDEKPKKRTSIEQKLQMMKEEYNKKMIEEKKAKLKAEADGTSNEPHGPLARFIKAKNN